MDMDEFRQMIDDCEVREERMTDWERGFIDSLSRREAPADREAVGYAQFDMGPGNRKGMTA